MLRPDLSSIQPGMVVKNYSELCALLGIKPSSNMPKQLKAISKYLNVSKIEGTRQYIINSIVEEKDYDYDPRKGSTYTKEIQDIILDALLNATDHQLICTHRQLMTLVGGVNECFYESDADTMTILNSPTVESGVRDLNIELSFISDFKRIAEVQISSRINGALSSMEKRKLINVKEWYLLQTGSFNSRLVTDEEYETIRNIEISLFDKYKYSHWGEVFLHNNEKFKKDWGEALRDYGWYKVYRVKVIALTDNVIDDIKDYELNVTESKSHVNQMFIDLVLGKIKETDNERYISIGEALVPYILKADTKQSLILKSALRGITKNKK